MKQRVFENVKLGIFLSIEEQVVRNGVESICAITTGGYSGFKGLRITKCNELSCIIIAKYTLCAPKERAFQFGFALFVLMIYVILIARLRVVFIVETVEKGSVSGHIFILPLNLSSTGKKS